MTKVKLLSIAVVALVLLNFAILAHFFIQGARLHEDFLGPQRLIIEQLNLDATQKEAFAELIRGHVQQVEKKDAEMHSLKKDLYQKLKGEQERGEQALADQIGAIQSEVELIHFHHFKDLRHICRPEQIPAYNELLEKLAGIFDRKNGGPHPPKKPRK